jgi:hypothetical protein
LKAAVSRPRVWQRRHRARPRERVALAARELLEAEDAAHRLAEAEALDEVALAVGRGAHDDARARLARRLDGLEAGGVRAPGPRRRRKR